MDLGTYGHMARTCGSYDVVRMELCILVHYRSSNLLSPNPIPRKLLESSRGGISGHDEAGHHMATMTKLTMTKLATWRGVMVWTGRQKRGY